MKRTIAWIVAIVMIFAMLPAYADAADLNEALNVEGGTFEFESTGSYPWVVEGDHAMSGNAHQGGTTSTVSMTAEIGEGQVISFRCSTSSESNHDRLVFAVDNITVKEWSGMKDWSEYAYMPTTAGVHTFSWYFTKDMSVDSGDDCGRLDDVTIGEPIHVTGVELIPELNMAQYRSKALYWNIYPENAYNQELIFTSSDESVAVITGYGMVKGVGEGTATITATTVDGGFTDTCEVTVGEAYEETQFYGFLQYSGPNTGYWATFNDRAPEDMQTLFRATGGTYAAAIAGNTIYGFDSFGSSLFYKMDLDTMEMVHTGVGANGVMMIGMAYNYANETMYSLGYVMSESRYYLYTVDLAVGEVTQGAPIDTGSDEIFTFTVDTEGNGYALTKSNAGGPFTDMVYSKLYRIDLDTGVGTLIGSTGIYLTYCQSILYDHDTQQLFWAQFAGPQSSGLFTIDTETAEVSYCGLVGTGSEVCGLCCTADLPFTEPEMPEITITFVDGIDGTTIGTYTMTAGEVVPESAFPTPLEHEGWAFREWDYDGSALFIDTTITSVYIDPVAAAEFNDAVNAEGCDNFFDNTNCVYPWIVENGYVKSGNAGINNSTSSFEADITMSAGEILTFDYKVSSEQNYDKLIFSVNGINQQQWSGNIDWQSYTYTALADGTYHFQWSYYKDSSAASGDDTAYVDNVYVGSAPAVEGVTIQETAEVMENRRVQLEWTVTPEAAANKDVTFQSSDESVAIVDENGIVRGISEGTATITVTTVDGGFTDECEVTVTAGGAPITIYGYSASSSDSSMGMWCSFKDSTPESVTTYSEMPGSFAAAAVGNTVYGYLNSNNGYSFYRMDVGTMEPEILSTTSAPVLMTEMEYDYSTQTMYALGVNASNGQSIYIIDLETGEYSEVVNITCFQSIQGFAITTAGTAYGVTYGTDSHLVEIDLETGSTTDIGSTGCSAYYVQSMTYDHANGRLFWAQYKDASDNCLYEVDVETAECYACGKIGGSIELCGMFIPYEAEIYQNGDVDMNGQINMQDATLALRHVLGVQSLDEQALAYADMNADCIVNLQDVVMILRAAMGI
ncbi:MAG: Ig-like domain-containing protein [Christensenellales bacterium]